METSMLEVAMAILAAVGGGGVVVMLLAGWLGKIWLDRILSAQKFAGEVDLDLRQRRMQVYPELWKATSLLPKWPYDETVTYEQLRELSNALRRWYYETGGLYLSRTTHEKAYGPLQGAITSAISDGKTGRLSREDYEAVRRRCSLLRSHLAADIESRRDSPID